MQDIWEVFGKEEMTSTDKESDIDYDKNEISKDENITHGFSSKLVDFIMDTHHKIEDFKKLKDKEIRSIFLDLEETI